MVTLHLGPVKVTLSFILSQIPGSPITIFEVQIWAVIFNQNILQISCTTFLKGCTQHDFQKTVIRLFLKK